MSTRMIALAPLQGRGAQRLIIASHRGPVEYELSQEQTLRPQRGVGGVVTALLAADSHRETTWVALAMTKGDRLAVQHARQDGGPLPSPLPGQSMHLHYVAIPAAAYRKYSEQISNHLLWFFHHYLPVPRWDAAGRLQEAWTNGYVVANRAIADAVCQEIDREATAPIVMLHDYQLYLAADIIRQRRPTVVMQQFIHIPWPEVRYWLFLPSTIVQAIYRGLMGNDIVGFQTERDARNFLEGAGTLLEGAVVDFEAGAICWRGRRTQVRAYPISISITEERRTVRSADGKRAAEQIRPLLGKYTIMRVDRIDPAKNIIRGFQAYGLMLEAHPELHREVTFLAFLVPSRKTVPLYRRYGAKVLDVIEQINRKFGKGEWTPIQAFCGNDRTRALAAMQWYDVLLVNPLMDGMNLVAKEGPIVNQRNGVLVLSRNAGVYQELARGAIAISPLDLIETADGLYRGLTMSPEEREQKATLVRLAVENNDLNAWFTRQLSDLDALVERGHAAPLPLKKPTAIGSAEKVAARVS